MRVVDHPILGRLPESERFRFTFNGTPYFALPGDSIASALLANGVRVLRYSEQKREPRGLYCGIGHCFECRVTVDGVRSVRACITPVRDGMRVQSQGSARHES